MKILIVKLSAIGDVIHTLPALNAIRSYYPHSQITWLVEEAASELLIGHPALDRVLISRRKAWIYGPRSGKPAGYFKEIRDFFNALRDTRYDLILDFQSLLKSGILISLSRGRRKAGFDKGMEHMEYSHLFLNERIPPVSMEHHALIRNLMMLDALGVRSEKIEYRISVDPETQFQVDRMLSDRGITPGSPMVAINPGAKWKTKLWHPDRFSKLADALAGRRLGTVVFTGSREDSRLIREIRSDMKEDAVDLSGQTGLKSLAGVYRQSRFLISTDTGPMHLAAALGIPVIALFGPTAPWRTGPFGEGHRILRSGLPCSPCFKRECDSIRCMDAISTESVMEAVDAMEIRLAG
ncbi:MAG: glycosyltransferase family 9 protein [Thermodesulfobacteriota bacterium]